MEPRVWKLAINLVWHGLANVTCYSFNILSLAARQKYKNYEMLPCKLLLKKREGILSSLLLLIKALKNTYIYIYIYIYKMNKKGSQFII